MAIARQQGEAVPTPHVLASGIVEPGAGSPGGVVAFVAVNFGLEGSRLYKLHGPAGAPLVEELPSATTVNLDQFQRELDTELQKAVEAIAKLGGRGAVAKPSARWVCTHIRDHLKAQGIQIEESELPPRSSL